MKFVHYFLLPLVLLNLNWGQTGHRTIGLVAEHHLSKTALRKIDRLLDGQSLASVSTYADEIKSDPRYKSYNPWHYVDLPLDQPYDSVEKSPKGDVVQAIQQCIAVLKNPKASREEQQFHLKLLVHFVGDLHQPLHVGRAEDRGGNDIEVNWFGRKTNLHRLWDSQLIDSHQMSYTELAADLPRLSPAQILEIKEEPIQVWLAESQALVRRLYNEAESQTSYGYEYRYTYLNDLRMRLLKGGIRLAALLEEVY